MQGKRAIRKIMITIVAGARPNFMKVAPIIRECRKRGVDYRFVHTGQHYDYAMSGDFIRTLGLPQPDVDLEVGSGTSCYQCSEVMQRLEGELSDHPPDVVLVVGDVNSTLGAALAASKLFIPLGHVEAGLRSFNRMMPEELNRIVVDAISDFLFTTEKSGNENLVREGRDEARIFFVGNTMIDSLVYALETSGESDILKRLGLEEGRYCYATLHRPSNVDDPERLACVLEMLRDLSGQIEVVFPVHPRTRDRAERAGLMHLLSEIKIVEPVGYLDSITLTSHACFVLTDSGGLQEEATFIKVPCLTLRQETERPVTVQTGTNILVSDDCSSILAAALDVISGSVPNGRIPPLWDGKAASRILDVLLDQLE